MSPYTQTQARPRRVVAFVVVALTETLYLAMPVQAHNGHPSAPDFTCHSTFDRVSQSAQVPYDHWCGTHYGDDPVGYWNPDPSIFLTTFGFENTGRSPIYVEVVGGGTGYTECVQPDDVLILGIGLDTGYSTATWTAPTLSSPGLFWVKWYSGCGIGARVVWQQLLCQDPLYYASC